MTIPSHQGSSASSTLFPHHIGTKASKASGVPTRFITNGNLMNICSATLKAAMNFMFVKGHILLALRAHLRHIEISDSAGKATIMARSGLVHWIAAIRTSPGLGIPKMAKLASMMLSMVTTRNWVQESRGHLDSLRQNKTVYEQTENSNM